MGDNVSIGDMCYVKKGSCVGDNTYMNRGSLLISGSIGKYCSIGFNCQIGQYEHPLDFVTTSERIYHKCHNAILKDYCEIHDPPRIGNDVWIGSNAMIMQGVTVGDGSVIAGGGIVVKDVPPYAVVGGVPTRVIRYRFNQDMINKLLVLEWWNKSKEWIEQYREYFESPEILFNKLSTE